MEKFSQSAWLSDGDGSRFNACCCSVDAMGLGTNTERHVKSILSLTAYEWK